MYYLNDLIKNKKVELESKMGKSPFEIKGKKRLNILAMGDVGGTLLLGLKLLGGDVINSIGICDVDENVAKRYEYEMNQISYPWDYEALPEIDIIKREELFNCDIFVFCASKAVPAIGEAVTDVRMVQFEANKSIIKEYAQMARKNAFKGLFAVVSDPVDPLCRVAYIESNKNEEGMTDWKGLKQEQIQGYGLGVMNSRAAYYAKNHEKFNMFLTEGRAFGPHGKDLVIANSIDNYDDDLSKELTKLAVDANIRTRETGFKPYIAPAISSGAISILLTLRGQWHYSSTCLGDVFLGAKNRMTEDGIELELLPLPEELYKRIENAYVQLEQII